MSSFSAQSKPSACCGRASGAGSDLSASGLAGVECREEDLDEGALGPSGFCKRDRRVASRSPPGNSLPNAVSNECKRSSTRVKCLYDVSLIKLLNVLDEVEFILPCQGTPGNFRAIFALLVQLPTLEADRLFFRALE